MKSLMSRYPDFYAESAEFQNFQAAIEPEVLALWEYFDSVLEQLHLETATWGLCYWERTVGLLPEETKKVEFRRNRVKAKLRGVGVTTVSMIQNVAESYSGGTVDVMVYPSQFRLEIKFTGTYGIPSNLVDLTKSLRDILPAHLQWDYIIQYHIWTHFGDKTWNHMGVYSWKETKEVNFDEENRVS